MSDAEFQSIGRCRCGATEFVARGWPLLTMICHCSGCRQMTGSAFSCSALYPASAFAVTQGAPVLGGLRREFRHYFCPECLSWLYTRPPHSEDFVNVRSTLLDEPRVQWPFIETHTAEQLPWVRTPAVHRFSRLPPPERFEALIAECRDWLLRLEH